MQPDISLMAEQSKSCLQEMEEVPRDITKLFDQSLFKLDTNLVPKIIKYES
jgi:intraflagellar transport protein 52